jgi:hypothetical protein
MKKTWPKDQCEGVVTSINGDMVTWFNHKTGETLTDDINNLIKLD